MLNFSRFILGQHVQLGIDLLEELVVLLICQSEPREQHAYMATARFHDAGSNVDRLAAQEFADFVGASALDAMLLQNRPHLRGAQPSSLCRCRCALDEGPKPRLVDNPAELQKSREVSMQLFAKPVCQHDTFGTYLLIHAAELAQLNQFRLTDFDPTKTLPIGPDRVSQHMRIAPIILCARDCVPIPKSVELPRVDRKNSNLALK